MRIRVQYTAQLRTVIGRAEEELEFAAGVSLAEVIVQLASDRRREAASFLLTPRGDLQPSLLLALNRTAVSPADAGATPLHSGDELMLMSPIAGG
jgi:molybdopterin converting factor small subunit